MALFEETIDDSASAADGVENASVHAVSASDSVIVTDAIDVMNGRDFVEVVNDTIAVTDAIVALRILAKSLSDAVSTSDAIRVGADRRVVLVDVVSASDSAVSQPIIALFVREARALSARKVRIDFSAPMENDEALRRPSSYTFDNLTPGSVDVVPLGVSVPAGQQHPLYVEIDVTEHTETATYAVTLSSELRGAAGETSLGESFEYTGIGVRPTLQLVLATSANEVDVYFDEPIVDNASARDRTRYQWAGGISTIDVKRVVENVVTLQTTTQTPGALYTLTVIGINPGVSHDIEINDAVVTSDSVTAIVPKTYTSSESEAMSVTDSTSVTRTLARTIFLDTVDVTDSVEAFTSEGDDDMIFAGVVTTTTTVTVNQRQGYNASAGTFQLNAPASPALGAQFAIVEVAGSPVVITVSGNGKSIWNPLTETFVSSFTIGVAGLALHWVYNGTTWSLI